MSKAGNKPPQTGPTTLAIDELQERVAAVADELVAARSESREFTDPDPADARTQDAPLDIVRPWWRRKDRTQIRFLAQSVFLEEAGTPRLLRLTLLGISGLMAAAIVWSAVTEIDEVVVGKGQVLPRGRVQVVQHLEGGTVAAIAVREGSLVERGQVLISLDKTAASAELSQARVRETVLQLQAERLKAFVEGTELKPARSPKLAKYRRLFISQQALLKHQRRARLSQRAVIQAKIKQHAAELAVLSRREESQSRQLNIIRETHAMRARLLRRGTVSRVQYLEIKRDFERAKGELAILRARKMKVKEEMTGAEMRLVELESGLQREVMEQREKVTAKLVQLREKLVQLEHRYKRLQIRAPARGYVQGLKVNTIGGVIKAGQPIMEIVPVNRVLFVESRISTRDIGHVKIGQPVNVKVDTYDFARYGGISGRLMAVSATTFQNQDGRPYYRGTIALDRTNMGRNPKTTQLLTGMTVTAEIVTGSKSVLAYLLKPIYTTISQSFHER